MYVSAMVWNSGIIWGLQFWKITEELTGCEEEEADSIKAGHHATVNTEVFVIHHTTGLGSTQRYAYRPNSKSGFMVLKNN